MALNLLDLPLELLYGIFHSMDDKSLHKMREVCHITESIAETTAINRTKDSKSTDLKLEQKLNKIDVTFEFSVGLHNGWEGEWNYILPVKLFFVSVMNYLQIADVNYNSKGMSMTFTRSDTISFFNRLFPLMGKVECKSLMLLPSTLEMLSLTSKLFEGKTVHELKFLINNTNQLKLERNDVLNLIRTSGPNVATVCFERCFWRNWLIQWMHSQFLPVAMILMCSTGTMALCFGLNIIPKVYLRARTLERNFGSRTNSARKHTCTVSKERQSGTRFNVIEMRHEEMERRYW
ncbi:hypothetical protein PENTCL1PPCAC_8355 [Pristionchus entomophagus]|uniref:F-box domain-containing protein n=1 Tax=Pristionchus entomophagus TaxID=358040 RepID=A0AAV5SSX8_9BILA|nr:hypothetical protein PENTCL1PPCAC_8354 [Pristionchus entomophagus]GMS86180.1 hypothetical protein PENTCL1PPCAC_8355 [Pristionchus entomophagus]